MTTQPNRLCTSSRGKDDTLRCEGQSLSSLPSLSSTATPLQKDSAAPVFSFTQLISPPGTSRSSMEIDNPFTEPVPCQDFARSGYSDNDDASSQTLSAFFGDDARSAPPAGSATSQPWRIPQVLARKQSQALGNPESSPLRHSFSCRNERTVEHSDSLLPVRRRLSISSGSFDNLSAKPCTTPRCGSIGAGGSASAGSSARIAGGSGSNADSPLTASNLKHLSSNQAARLIKSDAGAVDPYVN